MTEEKRYTRSASQLASVVECGTRFELERFKKIPNRPAAWTARGLAIHDAAMLWEKSGRTTSFLQDALDEYDRTIERFVEEQPDLSQWMSTPRTASVKNDITLRREDVKKQVTEYIEDIEGSDCEVLRLEDGELAVELPFELDIGSIPVRGYIDILLWWPRDEKITVRDLKTGRERKSYFQLGTYRFAAQKILGLDIDYGDYWYTKLRRSSGWIDLRRYDESYLTTLYERADRLINDRIFLPNPSGDCDMCPVMKYCPERGWAKWED